MAQATGSPQGAGGETRGGAQGSPALNSTEKPQRQETGRWGAAAPRLAEAYMAPGPGWVASPPLPGDGSREEERPWRPASLSKWPSLPNRWARPSGWAGECGARWPAQHIRPGRSPSPSPGCSRFIRPLPGCSRRGGGLAGGRASLPGSCLLLPPPSGSDIIPPSPRRSRSAERGFWEAGEGWRARRCVAGRPGAGV